MMQERITTTGRTRGWRTARRRTGEQAIEALGQTDDAHRRLGRLPWRSRSTRKTSLAPSQYSTPGHNHHRPAALGGQGGLRLGPQRRHAGGVEAAAEHQPEFPALSPKFQDLPSRHDNGKHPTPHPAVKLFLDIFVLLPARRPPLSHGKYSRLRAVLAESGEFSAADFHLPEPADDATLARAHDLDYIRRVAAGRLSEREQKPSVFPGAPPWSNAPAAPPAPPLGACRPPWPMASPPTWRAAPTMPTGTGEGLRVFNDAAVAARALQAEGRVRRVLVVDCDASGQRHHHPGRRRQHLHLLHPRARNFPLPRRKATSTSSFPTAAAIAPTSPASTGVRHRLRQRPPRLRHLPGRRRPTGRPLRRLALDFRRLARTGPPGARTLPATRPARGPRHGRRVCTADRRHGTHPRRHDSDYQGTMEPHDHRRFSHDPAHRPPRYPRAPTRLRLGIGAPAAPGRAQSRVRPRAAGYDVWYPNLAPSAELVKAALAAGTDANGLPSPRLSRPKWRCRKPPAASNCSPPSPTGPIFPGLLLRRRDPLPPFHPAGTAGGKRGGDGKFAGLSTDRRISYQPGRPSR